MTTPLVGKKPTTISTPILEAPALQEQTAVKKKAPAGSKTGVANVSSDGVDALAGEGLSIHSVRKGTAIGELTEAVSAGIRSTFPIDDLSQIKTEGRWAQGFRLDSGTLRLMWMTARRTEEKDGTKGFELFFQAHGPAIDKYRQRMTDQGATTGTYNFDASDVSGDAGQSVAKKNGQTWSPGGSALTLASEGKWSVQFVAGEPEALKGAFKIRVFGENADATKALKDVIDKLGLQSVFSPPTPNSLEKFKLFRLLWQIAPGAADQLRWKPFEDVREKVGDQLEKAGVDSHGTEMTAISKADLSSSAISDRVKLASALLEKNPKAFLDWVKQDSYSQNGILPGGSGTYYFDNALTQAGLGQGTPEYTAALAKEMPSEEASRALLQFGLLARKSPSLAEELLGRDVEQLKTSDIKKVLTAHGIDPEGDRVKNLRFEEVYPGYFTVVDPSLPERLKEVGARYLYSTSDNAERVWQQLTGGQKSSLTRFQEGILIQGKSSASDFGTGGAFSVFTRLVTESAIQKAKTGSSDGGYYSSYESQFNDWGGSRPYKLILNRRILERLDWYGFNGDNFGRSTGLTDANKAEKVIKEINSNYSSSNELMFPVGNDSAYVDFVVCKTEAQRTDLINTLKAKGIEEFNGKPVEKFVRVEEKFFEHPDDMTLSQAIKDAVYKHGFADAMKEADKVARDAAAPVIDAAAQEAAKKAALETGKASAKSQVEYYVQSAATTAASQAISGNAEAQEKLGLDKAKEAAATAASAAAKESAKTYFSQVDNYYAYYITSAAQQVVQTKLPSLITELATTVGKDAAVASGLLQATDPESKAKLKTIVDTAIKGALTGKIEELLAGDAKTAAEKKAEDQIKEQLSYSTWTVQNAASEAASNAAVAAANQDALAEMEKLAFEPARQAAEKSALQQLESYGVSWIQYSVQSAATTAAQQIAQSALEPKAIETALAQAQKLLPDLINSAKAEFAAAYPEKMSAEEEKQLESQAQKAVEDLARKIAAKIAQEMAPNAANKYSMEASKEVMATLSKEIAAEVATAQATTAAKAAAETTLRQIGTQVTTTQMINEACKAAVDEIKPTLLPQLVQNGMKDLTPQSFESWLSYYGMNTAADTAIQLATTGAVG